MLNFYTCIYCENSQLLPPNTNVTLLSCHKDPYNRTVAEVIDHKGLNINKEILKLGYVVAYPFEKGCDEYLRIEKDAREHKRGIHVDKTFEKPWDWRKKNVIKYLILNILLSCFKYF